MTLTSPCNADRFIARAMADEAGERSYCRCCGKRIAYRMGDDDTPDGYCRFCERGHVPAPRVERPRLFAGEARPS